MVGKPDLKSMRKYSHPILERALPRLRLFAQMDRLRKYPLIWVFGPPGSRKSTTVAGYLEHRRLSCLWYQIDESDADPASLFYNLAEAVKRVTPRKRTPLPLFTPEYFQGLSTFTFRYFENLYRRLPIPAFLGAVIYFTGSRRTCYR